MPWVLTVAVISTSHLTDERLFIPPDCCQVFSYYLEFVAICCIMEGGKKHSVFYLSRLFAGRMTDVRVQGGLHEDYWFFT